MKKQKFNFGLIKSSNCQNDVIALEWKVIDVVDVCLGVCILIQLAGVKKMKTMNSMKLVIQLHVIS